MVARKSLNLVEQDDDTSDKQQEIFPSCRQIDKDNEMKPKQNRQSRGYCGGLISTWNMQRAQIVPSLILALFWALPMAVHADEALHLTGTKRTATAHEYMFTGNGSIYSFSAHPEDYSHWDVSSGIHVYVDGKYSQGVAKEAVTIETGTGDGTFVTSWSCAKDPWLNQAVTCTNISPRTAQGPVAKEAKSDSEYMCPSNDPQCFLSRKLVPAATAKLMLNGPPMPKVSGTSYTHQTPVNMTLHYTAKLAGHFYLEQWYCPPGTDEAPNDVPNGDWIPFGKSNCKLTTRGPLALNKNTNAIYFGIGKPAGKPVNGNWYVRASLDSDSYGRSLWSHWHKTRVQLPMHFKDAPNNKPAPAILAPTEGYVWSAPNTQATLQLKSKLTDKNINSWSYDIEWQRQRYVTKDNAAAYNKLNKGGFPSQIGATEDMHPWSFNNHLQASANPVTLTSLSQLNYQEMRPRSVEFSYRYRVRARVNNSQWSAWRYFIVEDANTRTSGMSRSFSTPDSLPSQPPQILAPAEGQLFAAAKGTLNKSIKISVRSNVKNPKPDHWRYQLQWRRAFYYTKENNDFYYCRYGQPKQNAFPRQTGLVPPLKVWDDFWTPTSGNLGDGDALWDPEFSTFSPNSTLFSYIYQFRVRAQRIAPEAYGPWSAWHSFIVENSGFNSCLAVKQKSQPNMKAAAAHIGSIGKQQSGQQSQQKSKQGNNQNPKIRFGAKVLNRTKPKTELPAVQQHAMPHENIRFGGKLTGKLAANQRAPAMQTMSGHLNPSGAPERKAGMGSYKARNMTNLTPHLKVLKNSLTVDGTCANLAGFITLRETIRNDGPTLAAGHARIYIKEYGSAQISSQSVPVPALAHGASTVVMLRAGARGAYRGKIPGRHVLSVNMVVNGKTTTSKLIRDFRPGFCQARHSGRAGRVEMRNAVKLNPQPEPPSAQRRLVMPK